MQKQIFKRKLTIQQPNGLINNIYKLTHINRYTRACMSMHKFLHTHIHKLKCLYVRIINMLRKYVFTTAYHNAAVHGVCLVGYN